MPVLVLHHLPDSVVNPGREMDPPLLTMGKSHGSVIRAAVAWVLTRLYRILLIANITPTVRKHTLIFRVPIPEKAELPILKRFFLRLPLCPGSSGCK